MTVHIELLHRLRVVVTTNMEVSWNLVDEDEAAEFAALVVLELIDCAVIDLLRPRLSFDRLLIIVVIYVFG